MESLITTAQVGNYPHWHDHWGQWLVIGIIVAVALFIGSLNYRNSRAFRIKSTTTLEPDEALDHLQARFARDGWSLGYRDEGTLILNADRNATFFGTAAIGCLSVWLALLHLLSARKTITVEIAATTTAEGSILVVNGSKTGDGVMSYVDKRLRELPRF